MMRFKWPVIYSLLAILLVAGCTWLWFDAFEKKWNALPTLSAAARENPMLAAGRLLMRHGYHVKIEATLAEALRKPVPNGMLVLTQNNGTFTSEQTRQLLAWIRLGNTLITQARWSNNIVVNEKQDAQVNTDIVLSPGDPIGLRFGVAVTPRPVKNCGCKKTDPKAATPTVAAEKPPAITLASIVMPNAAYPLQLDAADGRLQSDKRNLMPLFGDAAQEAVRVYAEGQGHVVLMARNYFDNTDLERYDHAELLLSLGQLNAHAGRATNNIVIVQTLDLQKWYVTLWNNFQPGLISMACALLLLLWVALRRFGPLLPEPDNQRRALIEHIDASGRWLWKVPGGRDLLLKAARASTNEVLQRRAPELRRMHADDQINQLEKICNLAAADMVDALQRPAAKLPIDFTRQIKTLRQLRKFYER